MDLSIRNRRFQGFILVSCFIFSAICLLLFISQVYSFVATEKPQIASPPKDNGSNIIQREPPPKDDFFRGIPKDSPMTLLFSLLGFIISLSSGLIIFSYLFAHERKEMKSKVATWMLLPEERLFVELLEKNSGELTQTELVKRSGFNKLKVSRVVKRLESLNMVDKHPYGMTNIIRLKTEIPEKGLCKSKG